MDQKQINDLIEKYKQGNATTQERQALLEWYQNTAYKDGMFPDQEGDIKSRMLGRLNNELFPKRTIRLWPRIAAAASIIMCLSIGGYFLLHKRGPQQIAQNQIQEILPGGNKAILTLANGQQISLSDAKNGKLAYQGSTAINKTANGNVVYNASKSEIESPKSEIQYNTINTPNGGKWNLTLADGTKVWLNAASSIKYPAAFRGSSRQVEITGEAYFEVAHNASKPFRVVSNGQTVEDIGTHFNINAYDDEPAIKTTLTEGRVKISKGDESAILKPGQQAVIQPGDDNITVREADTEEALAWQNGYFRFNNEKIESIMRKLSKWYNVEVVYVGKVSEEGYYGKISQSKSIAEVLKILEKAKGVHFKIEGRKVTVMP
jgi:transmembrane sensor